MPDHPISKKSGAQALLEKVLGCLQEKEIDFAIVHTSKELELDTTALIDVVFREDPRRVLEPVLTDIQAQGLAVVVQRLHYEVPYGFYYILSPSDYPLEFLHLDCLYDPYGINRYHLSTGFLLENTDRTASFPKVCEQEQALYLLIKHSIEESATIEQIFRIRDALQHPGEHTLAALRSFLGNELAGNIQQVLTPDSDEAVPDLLKMIRQKIQVRFFCAHPIKTIIGKIWTLVHVARRLVKPSGIFMVLVGPDGSGKTTVNTLLHQQLAPAFLRTYHFHWRPGLLPKLGRGQSNSSSDLDSPAAPAITSKYGTSVSLLRFSYYFIDFLIGYWLRLYPLKARTTFIIGERYFLDILVHPARYGFKLPKWLLRTTSRIIPKPDLTVLLGNDPETIHRRKAELPIEEIRSQLDKYSSEIKGWGQAIIVPTEGSPHDTAESISKHIIQFCARRH